jgi:hypothetical protein
MVMQAATPLPPEKRDVFLWRVSGYLDVHALRRPTDEQVGIAIRLALQGLVQRTPERRSSRQLRARGELWSTQSQAAGCAASGGR